MTSIAAIAALLLISGCGSDVIDSAKIEDAMKQDAARAGVAAQVKEIECPGAEESTTGHRFNCTLTRVDGGTELIPVLVTDGEQGNVAFGTEAR